MTPEPGDALPNDHLDPLLRAWHTENVARAAALRTDTLACAARPHHTAAAPRRRGVSSRWVRRWLAAAALVCLAVGGVFMVSHFSPGPMPVASTPPAGARHQAEHAHLPGAELAAMAAPDEHSPPAAKASEQAAHPALAHAAPAGHAAPPDHAAPPHPGSAPRMAIPLGAHEVLSRVLDARLYTLALYEQLSPAGRAQSGELPADVAGLCTPPARATDAFGASTVALMLVLAAPGETGAQPSSQPGTPPTKQPGGGALHDDALAVLSDAGFRITELRVVGDGTVLLTGECTVDALVMVSLAPGVVSVTPLVVPPVAPAEQAPRAR